MRSLIGVCIAVIMLSGCRRIEGSGNIVTERRSVRSFTGVEAGADFQVEVTQGSPLVEVEADDNLQKLIETRVSGDNLEIRFRKNYSIRNGHYLVRVSMPQIRKLESSGASEIRVKHTIQGRDKISLRSSGAGKIFAELEFPETVLECSGAGSLDISGKTRICKAEASGAGHIRAGKLLSEETEADASGAGNIKVHASIQLKARASGAGNIVYRGNPSVDSKSSGAGTVRRED